MKEILEALNAQSALIMALSDNLKLTDKLAKARAEYFEFKIQVLTSEIDELKQSLQVTNHTLTNN
jgi:hypothetical protein